MFVDNVEQFRDILKGMGDLYERKNHDYGGAIEKAIHEFGYVYSACMLFNKLERFRNLITKNNFEGKVGESLVDTLLDMANYAVETARVMQNDMEYVREVCEEEECKRLDEIQAYPSFDASVIDGDDGEGIF